MVFDAQWAEHLIDLQRQLNAGVWKPLPTTCFIAQRPKARQIHAPHFSDRVVHHWLVPQLERIYEPRFIHDSYANRRGKGTHAAVERLKGFVRQVASGQGGGWYLQLDVHNFFNSIHRPTLYRMLKETMAKAGLSDPARRAVHALLRRPVHDQGIIHRSTAEERERVPAHKRLENAAPGFGLPIGNLSSQFFANVYLDALDQFVKHELKACRYLRYVDDFVLVHRDRAVLAGWQTQIEEFLATTLRLKLKADIRLRPLSAGIDFLGYVIYPTHTRVRARVLKHADQSLRAWHQEHAVLGHYVATPADVRALTSSVASYQGHTKHANARRVMDRMLRRHPCATFFAVTTAFHPLLEGKKLTFKRPIHMERAA
uniref:Reverse transcriptase n=1 Tax=Mycena chlorophos TaxID=658473 RepID=A0ABQ0L8A1_MYCCL|nr:reverse transcriptase [Mycena chlorophos]